MPVTVAEKAKRLGLAVSTADPRRAQLLGARGSDYRPNAIDVVDIDAAIESGVSYIGPGSAGVEPTTGRTVRIDPVTGIEFVEVDRGPALTGLAKVS